MKISILVDNNTITDQYFYGEPAVSYFIEDNETRVLFDVGYSDVFLKNAVKLGINLASIDYLVLSHGHNDHTGGLSFLMKKLHKNNLHKKPALIAHPRALIPKFLGTENIGSTANSKHINKTFSVILTKHPYQINDNLIFLGEIPTYFEFESRNAIGFCEQEHKQKQEDMLIDDSALVYKSKNGLVIITGCSHSGICNIIKHAQKICGEEKIVDLIGGFHLLNTSVDRIEKTVEFLTDNPPSKIHACHCTDFAAKKALSNHFQVSDVGSGMQLIYDK
jgi:7,8-dihydropterin-6-yl-methyl-4-(beta-D-ribofuranosyl)aminobenzene 5'-phosphate synthase